MLRVKNGNNLMPRKFRETKIVIASHNEGKVEEIKIMLKPLQIEILSANYFNLKEPIEDGNTFEKNALIKSSYVCKKTGIPSLSDDSGICFCDLNNEPGIYSARWAGKEKNFNLAMSKINDSIKKVENPNYKCFFVCALSLSWPDENNITVSGKIDGKFSWPPKGKFGFGYDPIFYVPTHGCTSAELSDKQKNE